jgi:hypothetical protein
MNTPYQPYRTPFWRLALGGVIAGAMIYFFPFFLPLAALLLVGWLLFGGRRRRMAMAWQRMSAEQRADMQGRFAHRCHGPWHDAPMKENPDAPAKTI